MHTIKVNLGNGYEIRIGARNLSLAGRWLTGMGFSGKLVLITDETVSKFYGESLSESLTRDGFRVTVLTVPEGEQHKSLEVAARLYDELTHCYAERNTPVLALGGGVIGDLAGFVAATYMRGIPLIHLPTTLLAQVDSSIGGKTAVDHGPIKNRIGVFYQPRLVITDVNTRKTLPREELSDGLAEIIKSAAIRDADLFEYLERNIDGVKELDEAVLEEVVYRTAKIKTDVVEQDERDLGLRNILNFGHTAGHAIESVSVFKIGHGQAVAIGMVAAAKISNLMGYISREDLDRLVKLIERAGLPLHATGMDSSAIISNMKYDKKVSGDRVRFILLKSIGEAFISDDVTPETVEEALGE